MAAPTRSVAVLGSLNIDFVTVTPRLPSAGETLQATSFSRGFGGKGANQAVAAARLASADVTVRMIGHVGADAFGAEYLAALRDEGIDVAGVKQVQGQATGVTNIIVEEGSGENRILFVANANFGGFARELDGGWDVLTAEEKAGRTTDVLVTQLEVPIDVVLHNLHQARSRNVHTILNPAPAQLLPDFVYQDIDTLILNETEAMILAGRTDAFEDLPEETAFIVARSFLQWGVREAVIITLGAHGLIYATSAGSQGRLPARKVTVVDTTAAGDTFLGAYAVHCARHVEGEFDIEQALRFATLAASKAVEKPGAMASIPHLRDLEV